MRLSETAAPWLNALRPEDTRDLSAAGRVRMLDWSFARHRFGISIMPFVAVPLVWMFSQGQDAAWLAVWAGFFVVLAMAVQVLKRRFTHDLQCLPADPMLRTWQPRIEHISLLHGAGLSAAVVLTAGHSSYEFELLLYVSIASITASNATHQNASLSVFLRFFLTGWVACIALSVWAFPAQWPYVLPLSLLFGIAVYRDALAAHRFLVEQVRLEERGQQLIEQLKVARQSAELALQEKNLFLSTASHDLRQPIHAMSLLVEAIAQRNQDPGLKPLLADLKIGMNSMNFMFTSLLDLTKLENGIVEQRAAPVAIKGLLRDTVILFSEQANQRGLALRIQLPRDEAHVWADPSLLRQALVNLVHNALRYTERGGILIGLRRRDTHWQLEVWDTGVGITEEDGAQIFSPYFRNQHAWRLDSAGHGLGLAVVARCARLMDTSLGFQSRLGRGSRFWLRLPVHVAMVHRPEHKVETSTTLSQLHGSCLVLDDDPQVLAAWKALLEGWGVIGRYATTAREALQHLDAGFTPDAVFCDQRLRSGESGFEILKTVLGRCPQAGGAMVSGEFSSPDLQEAEREGYLVLHKPLDPAVLHTLLSRWL
ncbi:MAG: hybrid sensor histidine kinase/response regulator [Hydrogenophaga sp.]|uniref:ATP-binding response regulator n=1 Tax=Hydrogenophaga sp. TaxID=1904254 RepID=UPI002774DE8B|nr:hybrid sensor histidine kinase/response regulator [Hydrogenophaga sp.]MDP2419549.1 hybrid sensor histidine kinase/response regulator [Hydrogenophaga sp.]MDZ4173271.1 hybrid sensor histidine kinase/response regulator [Hydrogenophaga sp.]